MLALWCDLNGPNYDVWVRTFGSFAWIALAAAAVGAFVRPKLDSTRLAVAAVGLLITAISIGITVARYGDGRPSSTVPGVLAWISLGALTVAAGAVSMPLSPVWKKGG